MPDGDTLIYLWLGLFVAAGLIAGIASGFFKARKIQPKGFKWKILRHEVMWNVINIATAGTLLGLIATWGREAGWITFNPEPASWWVILLEYALAFFLFDTWFYWLHRWMHVEPMYKWIHKIHHKSTSPTVITTASVTPLESLINGGFVPLFTALFTVHAETFALIAPTNIIMGLYVHSGYEFLPRWWHKTWFSKWFITTTFHDHHHHYFRYNFGGYTPIWDYICGTVHPKYERDFLKIKDRARASRKVQDEAAPAEG